jgi:1-phosphatidylinositol-4-phosphate 5-kinase
MKTDLVRHQKEKFEEIQRIDGISPQTMLDSLNIRKNREMIFKAGEGSGSSGSFFFFSKDNKFLIKTINKQEKDIFLSMIDSYIEHIKNG